jgi:hypothetical protein
MRIGYWVGLGWDGTTLGSRRFDDMALFRSPSVPNVRGVTANGRPNRKNQKNTESVAGERVSARLYAGSGHQGGVFYVGEHRKKSVVLHLVGR